MPQCKLSCCKEQAVPHGKRYCPKHLAEYKAKRDAYAKIEAILPECASGIAPDCTGKLSKTRHDAGDKVCLQCQRFEQDQADQQAELCTKMNALDNAETVNDLREWIKEYVLVLV